MKLLFISEVYTPWQGGAIVAIRNLMRQLVDDGNEVAIITGERRKQWRLWGTREEFDEECGVNVYRIPAVPYPFNRMSTMTIPDFAGLKRILEKEMPDCINIFSPIGMAEKILLSYAKHMNIPVVVTNHIMPENFTYNVNLHRKIQNFTDKVIYDDLITFCNKADFVTAPTQTAIDILLAHGLRTKYEAITNGVDTTFFHPGKPDQEIITKFGLDKQHQYILYVGRLDGEKRVDLLIQAMPYVIKSAPNVKLLIAGKGIKRKFLERLVIQLRIKKNVHFLGKVTEVEKRGLLQCATLFAIASPSELQCISGLEALSCGLPLVVADRMALKELVNNEKNGLLFKYPDSGMLADKLILLLKNTALSSSFSKHGREWILAYHQLAKTKERFEKIYFRVTQ